MPMPVTTARARPVIAIDGPGGSGKSTVAREVAHRLGWRYLDSGALYRAVTTAVLDARLDVADTAAVADVARGAVVMVSTDPGDPWTELDGERVSERIRSREVTAAVSAVSAVAAVREHLLHAQRALIGDGGIVVEGRDIGSTVVPDAEVKVFLTAAAVARAQRRHSESAEHEAREVAETQAAIERRDALDAARSVSPLVKASDAVEIDTTDMSVEDVVTTVIRHYRGLAPVQLASSEADA